jgi:hypothetical protein
MREAGVGACELGVDQGATEAPARWPAQHRIDASEGLVCGKVVVLCDATGEGDEEMLAEHQISF